MATSGLKISSKGQITVPLKVRQRLGVKPGDKVEFVITYLDEGRLEIISKDAGPVYASGTYSVSASGTDSTANDLADLTGSGQSKLTFVALDSAEGLGDSLEYSAGLTAL